MLLPRDDTNVSLSSPHEAAALAAAAAANPHAAVVLCPRFLLLLLLGTLSKSNNEVCFDLPRVRLQLDCVDFGIAAVDRLSDDYE
jgi:hypothetical protein